MRRLGIRSPNSFLIGTYDEGMKFLATAKFPLIGKKSKGFGSKTVNCYRLGG